MSGCSHKAKGPDMEGVRRFISIVAADLLERTRSLRFWLAIAAVVVASWWCFPPLGAKYMVLGLNGQYRGQYSSAWIGMVLAMVSTWLSLIGFYLVRGTLTRDIETRVWQLLVATPLRRGTYLLAKWCSHLAVLILIVMAGIAVGAAAQWIRAEDRHIDLFELLKPVVLLQLPGLALTAMFAVCFDLVPWLRRSAGNTVYFVLWLVILICSVQNLRAQNDLAVEHSLIGDPFGIAVFNQAVHQKAAAQIGQPLEPGFCLACGTAKKQVRTFDWAIWYVDYRDIPGRLIWLILSGLGVMLCAPFLDRAASRVDAAKGDASAGAGSRMRWLGILLSPLQRSVFGTLLASEVQLTLRRRKLWWWLAMLVSCAVQAFASTDAVCVAVIAAWMLCIDIYSRSALRESEAHTAPVIFSAAHASMNILLARWTMLAVLGAVFTLPAILRFAAGQHAAAAAVLIVGVSLATWSLALGALTSSPRPFELLVCILAYISINGAPVLNVGVDSQFTIVLHAVSLLVSIIATLAMWPRLIRAQFG